MNFFSINLFLIFSYLTVAQDILPDEVSNNIDEGVSSTGENGSSSPVIDSSPVTDSTLPNGLINWLNTGSDMLKKKLSYGADTLNKAISIGNNTAHLAASMGSTVAKEGTDYLKQGVNTVTTLGQRGIDNGVELANQILELIEVMPVIGVISEIGRSGVNSVGNFGKNALNVAQNLKNAKLNFINNLAQRASRILTNLANTSSVLGQTIVTGGTSAINDGIDNSIGVINQLINGLNNLRSFGSRLNRYSPAREDNVVPRNIIKLPPRQ